MLRVQLARSLCKFGPIASSHVEQLFVDGGLKEPQAECSHDTSQTISGCRHERSIHFQVDTCFTVSARGLMPP